MEHERTLDEETKPDFDWPPTEAEQLSIERRRDDAHRPGRDQSRMRRVARGAFAGALATIPMSAVQIPGALTSGVRPPPFEIVKRLGRVLPVRTPRGARLVVPATVAHIAFGAAAGALYGFVAPSRVRLGTGVGFAGALWAASYLDVLPRLRLMPPATRDDRRRQIANALAHVLWGVSVAGVMSIADCETR
jgi:hypothetical protein